LRLLSIDWDYFFPDPIGGPMFYTGPPVADPEEMQFRSWRNRLKLYVEQAGTIPATSGEEDSFWEQFRFNHECRLFVAQFHRCCAHPEVRNGVSELWSFDAHHDAGYEDLPKDSFSDENWMMAYTAEVLKHVRYPQWKTHAFEMEPTTLVPVDRAFYDGGAIDVAFDVVFLCRTDDLVPPWLDDRFEHFVASCPANGPCRRWPLAVRRRVVDRLKSEAELGPFLDTV
jgi:hypothetical protein